MNRLFLWIAAAATVLALAACNSTAISTPAPGPTCRPPAGTQSALVYPAPDATAVPDSFGQIVIGSTQALPSSWNVVVSTVLATTGGGKLVPAPSPLPTPNAVPSFPNPVYQSSSFAGATFPGEVVQVYLNDTSTNCTPLGPIAKFTTQ